MGRQAYLTRLALGRSAFGDLLRDQKGDVVLGPHAHDDAAKDYVQQFDEKGRSVNREIEITNRKLRRAQNEVLRVAGVVRKKGDPPLPQPVEIVSENDKIELIIREFTTGFCSRVVGISIDSCFQWWLQALRKRIYVSFCSSRCYLLTTGRCLDPILSPHYCRWLDLKREHLACCRFFSRDSFGTSRQWP